MVNHEHKFIFLHIPKCGGISIRTAFRWPKMGRHMNAKRTEWEFPKEFDEYFTFSFVRNPWSRFLSAYTFLSAGGIGPRDKMHREQYIKPYSSFEEFVRNIFKIKISNQLHFRLQTTFVNDKVDFIGRFENFQEDFDTICDRIGIPRYELPHKNKTKHKHYTEYYDDETREIVGKYYKKDIETFDYRFGE